MLGRRRHLSSADPDSHGIDLAPMLDFVINLLIFFIITAVFVKESGIVLNRSTGLENPTESNAESIVIQITGTGEIFVDNRVVDPAAVRANVERLRAVSPESAVLIVANSQAPTGILVAVGDQVRRAGVFDVTFNTQDN
jgi:biopolymer transport protein ExbD